MEIAQFDHGLEGGLILREWEVDTIVISAIHPNEFARKKIEAGPKIMDYIAYDRGEAVRDERPAVDDQEMTIRSLCLHDETERFGIGKPPRCLLQFAEVAYGAFDL
jgi:hypothetical protein